MRHGGLLIKTTLRVFTENWRSKEAESMSPNRAYSRIPAQLTKMSISPQRSTTAFTMLFASSTLATSPPTMNAVPPADVIVRRDSGGIFLVAVVVDRNGCAGTAEPGCDCGANATGGASDQRDLVLKS